MFKVRLISGIVLVALALLFICSGGMVLFAASWLISIIGMRELYRAMGVGREGIGLLEAGAYAGVTFYYGALYAGEFYQLMALLAALILLMCVYVFTYPRYQAGQVMAAMFGIFYVGVMLSCVYLARELPGGAWHVWLIFLCSWGCDTCAYCAGMLFGKHKMAPVLSPKKSVEGAVGGVLGAALLGALYALAAGRFGGTEASPAAYAAICAAGALVSMVGDLAASAIKRNQNIKDYGALIPGHGGILDRFDSVIFTAPIIYFLAAALLGAV